MKKTKSNEMDVQQWFDLLDSYNSEPFLLERNQPLTPERIVFEEHGEDFENA